MTGRRPPAPEPPAPEPLPLPVTDSHCHLDVAREGGVPQPVRAALDAAAAVGVTRVVQIGCDPAAARWAVRAAHDHPEVVAGVSLHPTDAAELDAAGRLDEALTSIDALATDPRVRAVGETGLDYYWTPPGRGRTAQESSFRAHVAMARAHGKALVIHDRDAHADVLRVLEDAGPPEVVVFHCFSGDAEMARYCSSRGWYLSFAGPVTFRNGAALRAALAVTPLDRVLVETDAPYLTPHPYRGRPNAPHLVPLTVRAVAGVLERPLAVVCAAVQANTSRVFGDW